jgi:hypothetical protein
MRSPKALKMPEVIASTRKGTRTNFVTSLSQFQEGRMEPKYGLVQKHPQYNSEENGSP